MAKVVIGAGLVTGVDLRRTQMRELGHKNIYNLGSTRHKLKRDWSGTATNQLLLWKDYAGGWL
jgi:hypothetical protein